MLVWIILRQKNMSVLVHRNITAVFQQPHGAADAGLGIAHPFADINGADKLVIPG